MKTILKPGIQETILVLGLILVASVCAGCGGAQAPPDPTSKFRQGKPYQVTLSLPSGQSLYNQEKIFWDGKGCIRMDLEGSNGLMPRTVNVYDMNKNETIVWTEGTNSSTVYKRSPARQLDPLVILAKPNVQASPSDALGAKTIKGHNCHGWKGQLDPTMQMWLDDDSGCIVEMDQGGKAMTLTSYTAQGPGFATFQPPGGYTQSSDANASGTMGGGRQPVAGGRTFPAGRMHN